MSSRSNGEDLTRSPAMTALDAVSAEHAPLALDACRAVEAPTMSLPFSSSSSQTVTDNASKVSEINFADTAQRRA